MSRKFSPELTFLPVRFPHEIVNRKSGNRLIERINVWLIQVGRLMGVSMWAKLDPHHDCYGPNETYLVEVNPVMTFELAWVNITDPSHAQFCKAIDFIIDGLRTKFRLVPSLVKRKGNNDLHLPQGGAHQHLSADIYSTSPDWYRKMERFHRNLVTDYANRPYARWLLAHWMGGGSSVVYGRESLVLSEEGEPFRITPALLFDRAMHSINAIEPRYMASGKNSYNTFEFRIVGMVENARQLCAAVRLLKAWVDHHATNVEWNKSPVRFRLTTKHWDDMVTEEGARQHCRAWIESLGLPWVDYEVDFFERNCLMRIRHGKME